MNKPLVCALTLLLVPLPWFHAFAQADFSDIESLPDQSLQAAVAPQQDPPRQPQPVFSQAELDQMLAPIALYPDSLLSQILMASTYPLEVIEAARWSAANSQLKGEQAVQAVSQFPWDPSVKALVAFPQILAVMDDKLTWMERLGDAFLSQRQQVMDTVQSLRQKAADAGNLATDDHLYVTQAGSAIAIAPVNPRIIYVPYYDPMLIYGPWWWSAYPPVYWAPWPGYYVGTGFNAGFTWGWGTTIGGGWFWSGFSWPSYQVLVGGNQIWFHDSLHRRGIPYRDFALHRQFGRMGASPGVRGEFRGYETPAFGGRPGSGYRPDIRFGSGGHVRQPGPAHIQTPGAHTRPPMHREFGGRGLPPRAFEGAGHGSAQRPFNAPDLSQGRSFAPPSGFHGGSGFQGGSGVRGGGGMHGGGGFHGGGHGGGGGHHR